MMLKGRVFGGETGPIATVRVIMHGDPLQRFGLGAEPDPQRPGDLERLLTIAPIEGDNGVNVIVSEVDIQRQLPHHSASMSQSHYRIQHILYRACASIAQRSDSASTDKLGKFIHLREAYFLDIDK